MKIEFKMFFERFPNEIIDKILDLSDMNTLINLRDVNYFRPRVGKFIIEMMNFDNVPLRDICFANIEFINTDKE